MRVRALHHNDNNNNTDNNNNNTNNNDNSNNNNNNIINNNVKDGLLRVLSMGPHIIYTILNSTASCVLLCAQCSSCAAL